MIKTLFCEDVLKLQELFNLIKPNYDLSNITEDDRFFVFYDEEKIVGFIEYRVLYETADIINIAVHPNYEKKGIGTKLVERLIDSYFIEHVMLEVRESNTNAINFYKKNKFEIIRTIKNYYGNDNALVMERKL